MKQKYNNPPQFAVVTTTYKRPELLIRCVRSVLPQLNYGSKMIVVNDSPDEDYRDTEKVLDDHQEIIYIKNKKNLGKNYSVNRALDYLKQINFDGYIIFLDDDDWLAPSCLEDFAGEINRQDFPIWLVSNRVSSGNKSLTMNKTGKKLIHYFKDYLLLKRFSGDATHCIKFQNVVNIRMPKKIKNAEEWLYFAQVANIVEHFVYMNKAGTYSEGYLEGGLTRNRLSISERMERFMKIFLEIMNSKIYSGYLLIYLILRFAKIFL